MDESDKRHSQFTKECLLYIEKRLLCGEILALNENYYHIKNILMQLLYNV
ncbi:hypothetical protein [Paenibacillus ihuae]|nr:hypothetical protein [Paenibacillus ihuae]